MSEPRATSAIPDILGFIGMVLDSGHAYQAGGSVYFSVASFGRFGQVSHYDRDTMLDLAAERGGNPDDPHKRDPWTSSCGSRARPMSRHGSRSGVRDDRVGTSSVRALALRELGQTIDIHGGDRPHVPAPRVRGGPVRVGDR